MCTSPWPYPYPSGHQPGHVSRHYCDGWDGVCFGPCSSLNTWLNDRSITDILTNLFCGFSGLYLWDPSPVLNSTVSPLPFQHGKSGSFSPSDWEQSKTECAVQWDEVCLHTLPGPTVHLTHRDATHGRERPCVLPGLVAKKARATVPQPASSPAIPGTPSADLYECALLAFLLPSLNLGLCSLPSDPPTSSWDTSREQ